MALATYAAAGIAKSNPMKTGFTALVTAMAGFLVPYMFVYNPHLLFQGNILQITFSFITALMAIIGLSAGVQGYYIAPSPFRKDLPCWWFPSCSSCRT